MKQIRTSALARSGNTNPGIDRSARIEKITKLSRLSSNMELLESRTMMSAATLVAPAPLLAAAKTSAKIVTTTTLAVSKPAVKTTVKAPASSVKAVTVVTLSTPAGLTATGLSATQIKLTWNKTNSASGYYIYRSTDGVHFTQVGKETGTTFTDTGLSSGQAFKYQVQAFSSTATSAMSAVATGVTLLAAPSSLVVSVTSSSQTHLAWIDNASSATGYVVLRSTDGKNFSPLSKLTSGAANSLDDKTASTFKKNYYEVEATTAVATSAASNMASATTPLAVPSGISATAISPTSVKITWTDSDPAAQGFAIYRAPDGANFTQVETIASGKTTTWTDNTAASNHKYTYEVKATNGSNASALSAGGAVTTPLFAPTGLAANSSGGSTVVLNWKDNDSSATGYTLSRGTDGAHFTRLVTITSGTASTYTDTTAASGQKFSYEISATAGTNASAVSNIATASTTVAPPSDLHLTAPTGTAVVLTWIDHDTSAIGYNILRSTDNKTFTVLTKLSGATTASYTDGTTNSAHTYYYRVQAFNSAATSAASGTATITTPLLAPAGLAATVAGTNISLSWTDKDSAATGYRVLRSTNGSTFTQLTQITSATAHTYTDTTATAGTKYYYQVQATSSSLTSPVSGTASATVTAQDPTPAKTSVTIATRYTGELVITATGTSDTVSVTQSGSTLTIVADGQTTTQPVPTAGLFIYARGGTDGITVDQSVTVLTTVETIDGVVDDITSHGTDVSVWDDPNDIFTGTGTVHSVSTFAGGVSKAAGASLKDPSDSGTIMHASASLWGTGPLAGDVNQGNSGDCYFLSSLAAFAGEKPAMLQESAVDMGDGTYTVQYLSNNEPEYVRVSNDLPTYGNGSYVYARPGSSGSIWAAIMEKAYAFFRTGANTYASISSGWMGDVYAAFGVNSSFFYLNGMSESALYARLSADLAGGRAVTLGTSGNAPQLVSGHAYTLISCSINQNGVTSYVVRNPWGVSGDSLENSQGYATLTFAQMVANFQDCCEATS